MKPLTGMKPEDFTYDAKYELNKLERRRYEWLKGWFTTATNMKWFCEPDRLKDYYEEQIKIAEETKAKYDEETSLGNTEKANEIMKSLKDVVGILKTLEYLFPDILAEEVGDANPGK